MIALGCWAFGGGDYWANSENDGESLATIDRALDLGINFFDTADSYGGGHSDEVLGRAMKGRRDKFVIASKAYLDMLREKDLTETVERGLRRMGTDYIALFYPHFASREIPFEETFGTLLKLKRQGKIRAIGMSNFGVRSIRRVAALGLMDEIAIDQLPYSLLWRAIEYGIQQETVDSGVGIICRSGGGRPFQFQGAAFFQQRACGSGPRRKRLRKRNFRGHSQLKGNLRRGWRSNACGSACMALSPAGRTMRSYRAALSPAPG